MNTNIILNYIILSLIISIIITIIAGLMFKIKSHKTLTLIFLIILTSIILTLSMRFNHKYKINNINNTYQPNNPSNSNTNNDKQCTMKSNWTEDHIIPLNKYNQCDCTNDDTCIIKPNKQNLVPGYNTPKKIKIACNDFKINNENETNQQQKCLSCDTLITNINNPVTENFTTYDPYRPTSLYKNPESLKMNSQISKILNKISPPDSENEQLLPDKFSKNGNQNLCIHCKKGLCLNDYCTDI